ncbi:MAG: precorrin-8X methylmutase [Alphaproteobacteria bacterium]|jgi:precorrin-8X/cobalt-precorrin-8 methylmutase
MPAVSCHEYLTDPSEIYRRSFNAIAAEANLARIPDDLRDVALRIVHACGEPAAADELAWSDGAGMEGRAALATGMPVLTDAGMVAQGIIRDRLPATNRVICTLTLGSVSGNAIRNDTTRSAAAVELWRPWLAGAVVAIGNAPTALFRLLDGLASGWPKPALILGFPVGYVGAAEAKEALANTLGVPFVTLRGRRGGSAAAAAAVNALAGNDGE